MTKKPRKKKVSTEVTFEDLLESRERALFWLSMVVYTMVPIVIFFGFAVSSGWL